MLFEDLRDRKTLPPLDYTTKPEAHDLRHFSDRDPQLLVLSNLE